MRTVRFSVNPGEPQGPLLRGPNGYAAVPSMRGLGRHYELDVACRGRVQARTGYFINIKDIDSAARSAAVPMIASACADAASGAEGARVEPAEVMRRFLPGLSTALEGALVRVRWRLSPFYSVEMFMNDQATTLIRQRFEFAASHRLHAPTLSDEENRAVFGKCNNPSGHGHNYVVEPCVAVPLDAAGRQRFTLAQLERVVDELILRPFDHAHLNLDTSEFASATGLNPSVENISKVCYERLAPALVPLGVTLRSVTVWETEKTSSCYPG
ncbi:MAG: 6-carboxytetrahydropterin synthase [Phycisphaerales bacterium]